MKIKFYPSSGVSATYGNIWEAVNAMLFSYRAGGGIGYEVLDSTPDEKLFFSKLMTDAIQAAYYSDYNPKSAKID